MENRSGTIWIINQYASHLVTRHEELSKSFAAQGYRVAVITSSFHHGRREYMYEEPVAYRNLREGVSYAYLRCAPPYQSNGAGRLFNMLDFARMTGKYQKAIAERAGIPDYVIASSAPPFVWEAGYKAARHFNAKFIVELRDIWPLSLVDVQGVSPKHPLVKVLELIEKRAYRRADAIVSTMPYAWKHVIEAADVPREKVHWMPNGINVSEAEQDLNSDRELPAELKDYLTGHWCCVYIGSIVKSECLDYLLKGFSEVRDPDIFFAVIGEGHEKEKIMRMAGELKIANIRFFPAIDKRLIPKALELAAAAAAAVNEELPVYKFGLSMNKLNDYLAAGVPTVFAGNVDNIVRDAGHFSIPTGDGKLLAQTIMKIRNFGADEREELKKKAKAVIRKDYDYPEIGRKYLHMMESL